MQHYFYRYLMLLWFFLGLNISPVFADEQATALVKAAIEYWRDISSYSVADMTIHRPSWQRTMTMRMWTEGQKKSLVRVTRPKKDKGSATLIKNKEMWSFSPKTNRIIKIPSSMMNQSWMGSDFSNNDVSKADSLLEHYTHTLKGSEIHEGQKAFIIEAVPFEDAPVVWGKEVLKVRTDFIVLEHAFYDQDNVLVKKMETLSTQLMGGKLIATRQRMQKTEEPSEWTEIVVKEAKFKINVPSSTFTRSNLRNPRF
ncbi:outer membrane lipoprotein-sorting protein [Candidatus Parabeggiatoa sp. HSG14]|uniref:outer membrane lipoprotein-sorting protein n=1 Tax=Candidatus Parabeggiatoa sp. HSG14 TaxID=3055593 RepID=UPI0025A6B94D|nr:outer membrane lipoprotein-sorting protein [Thiotrichales bacterium HSG14]